MRKFVTFRPDSNGLGTRVFSTQFELLNLLVTEPVQAMLAAFEAWQDNVSSGVTAQPN